MWRLMNNFLFWFEWIDCILGKIIFWTSCKNNWTVDYKNAVSFLKQNFFCRDYNCDIICKFLIVLFLINSRLISYYDSTLLIKVNPVLRTIAVSNCNITAAYKSRNLVATLQTVPSLSAWKPHRWIVRPRHHILLTKAQLYCQLTAVRTNHRSYKDTVHLTMS